MTPALSILYSNTKATKPKILLECLDCDAMATVQAQRVLAPGSGSCWLWTVAGNENGKGRSH